VNDDLEHVQDPWVTIHEAARRLGVSTMTIRRRIRQGVLEAELEHGQRGPVYRVKLPPVSDVGQAEPAHGDVQDNAPDVAHLGPVVRLIERQQHQLTEVYAELRAVRERLEARTGEAAATAARAELLEVEVERLRAELERARRPWWRRMFGGRGRFSARYAPLVASLVGSVTRFLPRVSPAAFASSSSAFMAHPSALCPLRSNRWR
jgi:MerR family copper efflux transcriptional regulator